MTQAVRYPRTTLVIFGAILLGIATALKPTNGVHALAGFFLVAFVPQPFLGRIRDLFYFGATLGTSFVLTAAPWSYRLARMFGNPMFPLLNNVFKSPEITTASPKAYRFIPDSLTEALLRPFEMSGTGGMIHEEVSSPDIRYALLISVFLIFVIAWFWQSIRRASIPAAAPHSESATRALAALGCGFAADWIVWLSGSGNSRYFIPMACVAAVVAVALLFRLLGEIMALSVAMAYCSPCLSPKAPSLHWEPITAGVRRPGTGAGLTSRFRKDWRRNPVCICQWAARPIPSSFRSSQRGQASLIFPAAMCSVLMAQLPRNVRAMIKKTVSHTCAFSSKRAKQFFPDAARREPRQLDVDDILRPFGLRVDMSDCESITVMGLRSNPWRAFDSSMPVPPMPRYKSQFASCHLVLNSTDQSQELVCGSSSRRRCTESLGRCMPGSIVPTSSSSN